MLSDQTLVDRIVDGVLKQLGSPDEAAVPKVIRPVQESSTTEHRQGTLTLSEAVVTAEMLQEQIGQARGISISAKAIITPAAWDVIKELQLEVVRDATNDGIKGSVADSGGNKSLETGGHPLLVVVRHTEAVERLWQDLQSTWRRELLGCPDDAARLAISEISRGETAMVVLFAEQAHRAACLANRHEQVRAAVARDAVEVKAIRKQLRTNVWSIDPMGRSWFELRNLFRAFS